MSRTRYLAVAAVGAALGIWLFRPGNGIPQLATGPVSVSYDPDAMRLTTIVTIRNNGDRPVVAAITNDVFIDSRKQAPGDRIPTQASRAEFGAKQSNPVTVVLQGDGAADAWNGVRLMEVTVNAVYDGDGGLTCHFTFMGRLYPELKQIGTVSSATSPPECRITAPSRR